jgi:hypothetical protein
MAWCLWNRKAIVKVLRTSAEGTSRLRVSPLQFVVPLDSVAERGMHVRTRLAVPESDSSVLATLRDFFVLLDGWNEKSGDA